MELKQNRTYSPKQVARAIGVSEASIKRWCDKGILEFNKTAGGHRRIHLPVVMEFLGENDFNLAQPEVLGLPASVGAGQRTLDQARELYRQALIKGNEAQCLQVILDLRLARHDSAVIGDQVIAPAFEELGQLWEHGAAAVYQERRGVEITRYVLLRLKETLMPPDSEAPAALGATLSQDPYSLPGQLGELVLLQLGWQARFLGSELPAETVAEAVKDIRPRVLFLSISAIANQEAFVRAYENLYEICLDRSCAIVLGGRAMTDAIRRKITYASYGDTLLHLRAFAQGLFRLR
ncbi:B12-binding domain-containing protein [Planctomycetota bacterium]